MSDLTCRPCRIGFEYRDAGFTIDADPTGEPDELVFIFRCPRCHQAVRIDAFAYPPDALTALAAGPKMSDQRRETLMVDREDAAWAEIIAHTRREVFPKIADSAFGMVLAPSSGEPDVKICLELGALIMFDKPLVVLAMPGVEVPAKLRKIADRVVVADVDTAEGQEQAREAIAAAMAELGGAG